MPSRPGTPRRRAGSAWWRAPSAQLSAPGIAQVRESGEAELDDGRTVPYLVRDLVAGPTLDDRLNQGPLPAGEALRLVADVAGALDVAHRAGVAHGHLVPSNIVFGPGLVKITDFGLWPLRPRPAGLVPGGLSYAAPELAHGPATPAADMYALGVVFVACLAGIASGGVSAAGPRGRHAGGRGAGSGARRSRRAVGGLPAAPIPGRGPAPRTPRSCHGRCCPGRDGAAVAAWTGWVPAPRAEPTPTELAIGPAPAAWSGACREPGWRARADGPARWVLAAVGLRAGTARGGRTAAGPRRPWGPQAPGDQGRSRPRSGRRGRRGRGAGRACSRPHPAPGRPARPPPPPPPRPRPPWRPGRPGPAGSPRPESTSSVLASSPPSPRPSPDPAVPARRHRPAVPDHPRRRCGWPGPPGRRGGLRQPHRPGRATWPAASRPRSPSSRGNCAPSSGPGSAREP